MAQHARAARVDNDPHDAAGDPNDSLRTIADRLREFRDERDWHRFHTPRNLAMSIAIECGELLEHFQWKCDEELAAYVAKREDEVAEELADVAIYLVQLAETLDISLGDAIAAKIATNDQRYPSKLARGSALKHTELRSCGGAR